MRCGWLALLLACGPRVDVEIDDASGTGGTQPEPGTSSTGGVTSPPGTSTSTTGPFTTTDPSSSEGGPGNDFLVPQDFVCACQCSVWDQDCGEGFKCAPWANDGSEVFNSATCSPVDPDPARPGDPCTVEGSPVSGIDSCDVSTMCWGVDPQTLLGECVAFCMGSEDDPVCDDPSTDCFLAPESFVAVCVPQCHPFEAECAEGEGCWPDDNGSWGCLPAGVGLRAWDHQVSSLCAPGSVDVDADLVSTCDPSAELCCTPLCDLNTAMPTCADGLVCVSFYYRAAPGYEDVGVCVDPWR